MTSTDLTPQAPPSRTAREESYDVVVIGGGIGGLTAGGLLAHAGKRVLVVEADERPGGYARALQHGAYTFDRADHLISSCELDGPFGQGVIDVVLRELGVREQCEFLRVGEPFYVARFPGLELQVPCGREQYLEAHLRQFPGEARGLRRLAGVCTEIYREQMSFPMRPRLSDLARMPVRSRALLRYATATLRQVIDRELTDPRARTMYAALWGWTAAPPSQASFLGWATMMGSYIDDGAYYCRGSYQRLADAFAAGLQKSGGELLLGTRVARILTDDRRATGVELDAGHRIAASTVVSAIDARSTFEELVGADRLPGRFLRRLRAMALSPSVVSIHVGTDLDARALGARHETIVGRTWDIERAWTDGLSGRLSGAYVVIPSLTDPSLAPAGEHVVMVQGVGARESGETRHDDARIAEDLLTLAEDVLPGLREHLTFVESAPDSHPVVHRMGPVYGWTMSPAQTGPRRLAPTSPVGGLLLAGQWTRPGAGIFPVVESGIHAARLALGAPTAAPPLPLGLPVARPVAPQRPT